MRLYYEKDNLLNSKLNIDYEKEVYSIVLFM